MQNRKRILSTMRGKTFTAYCICVKYTMQTFLFLHILSSYIDLKKTRFPLRLIAFSSTFFCSVPLIFTFMMIKTFLLLMMNIVFILSFLFAVTHPNTSSVRLNSLNINRLKLEHYPSVWVMIREIIHSCTLENSKIWKTEYIFLCQ